MLLRIPDTAWIRFLDYIGLSESCKLRVVNKSLKNKIDQDIFFLYKRIEGKKNIKLSNYLNQDIIYPVLNLKKNHIPLYNFRNISQTYQLFRYSNLIDTIEIHNLFKDVYRKAQIYELNNTKLIKAIKLVKLGMSEHYSLKCMPLTNERIDWAISFKTKDICDIFCWRGAREFNESQKKKLLKIKQYTYQDCFAFEAAEILSDSQIDFMIEKKKGNMLDYYAMMAALEFNK